MGDVAYDLNPTRGLHPDYRGPAPVGSFAPNAFGLFDMAGNVAEWLDHFRPNTYRDDWQPWWDPARTVFRRAGGGHAYSGARNLRPDTFVSMTAAMPVFHGCRLVRPAVENAAQAEASFDARDYRLAVDGNRSNVGLSDGTHVFAWGAAIDANAGMTATVAGVALRCAGWIGSGSVPPSGDTASAGIVDLRTPDSAISWLYVPSGPPAIHDLTVAQRPGSGLLDIAFRLAGMPDGGVSVAIRSADDDRLLATIPVDPGTPGNQNVTWDAGSVLPESVTPVTVTVQANDSMDPDAGGGMAVIPRSALAVSTADGSAEYMLAVREPVEIDRFEVLNDEMIILLQWALQNDLIEVVSNFVWNTVGEPRPLLHVGPDFAIDWQPPNFVFSPSVQGAGFPCGHVSWYGAAAYCNWRSLREGLTPCYDWEDWSCDVQANGYRLPTGVEWELAARGGETRADYPWGDTITHMHANFNRHPDFRDNWPPTSPPGTFGTNAYGLADVCGNVSEWLEERTVTGGSYYWSHAPALSLRPWNRYAYHGATTMASHIGFRTLRRHVPAEAVASAAGVIDTRPYVLDVFSAQGGNPQPGAGRHVRAWGSVVTGQVRRVTVEWPVEYNLTGWTGSGIDPVTGNSNVAVFALTEPFAVLNWQWDAGTVIDSVNNGLRDAWELKYFGAIGLTGRDDDPDGDGYTNWEEYVMGTDPTDPDSTLSWRIDKVPGDKDAVEALIHIPAAGRWFDLQAAPDLTPPVQWQSVVRFPGTGGVRRVTLPSGMHKRFFRLSIEKEQP